MIISQTDESTWLALLRDRPGLCLQPDNLLVIAPHPDDETLACGGLISTLRSLGVPIRVLAVTDGENAYAGATGLAPIRIEEQIRALIRLGVRPDDIIRLHLPDSDVSAHESELIRSMLPLISPGTHILAPWTGDFHPDHEACGRAAAEVARRTGTPLTFWLFWAWHRGDPDLIRSLPLRSFALSEKHLRAKAEALLCHTSQLVRDSNDPILPEDLLAPARRTFEVFVAQ